MQPQTKKPVIQDKIDKKTLTAINAICADIYDIYSVDCKTKAITVIRQTGKAKGFHGIGQGNLNYDDAVKAYTSNNVFIKDRDSLQYNMRFENIYQALLQEESISFFYRVYRDGELHYIRLKCTRVGTPEHFDQIIYAFIAEDFKSKQSLMIRSFEMDDVTGVYNKQAFYQYASKLLEDEPEQEFDLITTDVDNFKFVNQIYGRSSGDKVLKYLAERFEAASRNGLCARYGADQFAILSNAMTDEEIQMFYRMTERLCVEAPLPNLTLHYGIYRSVDRHDTVAEMCDKAMLALRSNKKQDLPVNFYDRNVMQKHYRSKMYESNFEQALKNHEFVVWTQPKYNAFHGRITSAEALVRWKTAEGTFIPPIEFIPLFEEDGLIVQLDEYVFRHVCTQQKKLLDAGKDTVPISVNLSRVTLFHQETVEKYRGIIEELGVPKELVPLELTESAMIENEQIVSLMDHLKSTGFVLHLDDFGSGYSSLSSLVTLHLDVLKLDKSLIDAIGISGGDELLRHIIELAHFFQMEVVAEGVETNDQYQFLKKLSCDTIQGYLFSKPIPFDLFLELLFSQPPEKSERLDSSLLEDATGVGSLRITKDTKLQYLSALARIYITMHVIDLKMDTVVEFATTTNVKEHVNRVHNCVGQMKAAMTATVSPEYLPAILEFTDLTTIASRMKGQRTISGEFVGKHFGWFRARFITVTADENDEPTKLIYTTEVIEADKRREEVLIRACRTDELTGVNNLSSFEEDSKTLALTSDLSVMTVDINGLKNINDRFGRFAGDEVLWETAAILTRVLGKGSLIYRVAGDRFIAVFYANPERILHIRSEYETAVRNWIGNEVRTLSTSYGIASHAEFPNHSLNELVREAEDRRIQYKAERRQVSQER